MYSINRLNVILKLVFLGLLSCFCCYYSIAKAWGDPVQILSFEENTTQASGCLSGGNTSGAVSIQSSIVKTGSYALRVNPTTTGIGWLRINGIGADGIVTTSLGATNYIRFAFRVATLPASGAEIILYPADSGTTKKSDYRITSGGKIEAHDDSGTLIATGSTTLSTNTWYEIIVLSGTGASSNYAVYINRNLELSGTMNQGASSNGTLFIGKVADISSQSVDFYYDDFLIDNASLPAAGGSVALIPNGAGSINDFTAGTGLSNYTQCLEIPPDGLTTYVKKSAGASQSVLFAIEDAATKGIVSGSTINAVKNWSYISETAAATGAIGARFKCSGSNGDTTTFDPSIGGFFDCQQKIFTTCPGTGSAITTSNIDSAEIGTFDTSASANSLVSTNYLIVDFATPTPTPIPASGLLLLGVGK